jgi:hypothetical protein
MDQVQATALNSLRVLVGKWCGEGLAEFPTIPTFAYREQLEFTANDVQPLLRYEQRTWKRLEGGDWVPSHWETGFWRVLPTSEVEVLCAQSGGRVEVLRGTLATMPGGFALPLESTVVANDERVHSTAREYSLRDGALHYTMQMRTSAVPELSAHTHAELRPDDAPGR